MVQAAQSKAPVLGEYTLSVDTGGTFTDLVTADGKRIRALYKSHTASSDVFAGIRIRCYFIRAAGSSNSLLLLRALGGRICWTN